METPKTPKTNNKTSVTVATTVEKVRKSVNTFLEHNSTIDSYAQTAANTGQKLVSSYAPQVLEYLPEKKIDKEFTFVLVICVILVLLFWIGAARLIVDITGIIYPCYATILAIENPAREDTSQWVTYWIIYLSMKLTDNITYPILRVLPMYSVMKVLFMAWLYHPDTLGAKKAYEKARPHLQRMLHAIEPDFNTNNSAKSQVSHNNTSKPTTGKSPKKNKTESDESNAHLILTVGTVQLLGESPEESNIYVEATILPKDGRERQGIEGVCLKTNKILGTTCVFDHVIKFMPLPVLDGNLKVEVLDKPTFSEANSLGIVDISLLDLIPGGPKIHKKLNASSSKISITLDMELIMGAPSDEAKFDQYSGERNESGQYHGFGNLIMIDGSSYKGHFFKGKKHGNGVLVYKNLDKYIGEFRDGNRHGDGELRDSSNHLIKGGKWIDDHLLE